MTRLFILFCLYLLLTSSVQAYETELDSLLSDYVEPVTKSGIQYNGVDYNAWGEDERHETVLSGIKNTNPDTLANKDEKLAFWINAYNVLTIDLITRENETDTIKNLGSFLSSPWESHRWSINGKDYTLDHIEHKIIRPMGDARIHFAINCAAKSCPDLRAEAYRAEDIDVQLSDQVQKTFDNATKGYVFNHDQNSVRISKVMDWFKNDFDNGNLQAWLTDHAPDGDAINANTNITFFEYDWSLNSK